MADSSAGQLVEVFCFWASIKFSLKPLALHEATMILELSTPRLFERVQYL